MAGLPGRGQLERFSSLKTRTGADQEHGLFNRQAKSARFRKASVADPGNIVLVGRSFGGISTKPQGLISSWVLLVEIKR